MGCDIHLFVEKKVDGKWTLVSPKLVHIRSEAEEHIADNASRPERQARLKAMYDRFPGTWVNSYEEWEKKRGTVEERMNGPLYVGRNYDLFAILANVRNGFGFAGMNTGGGFVPIATPKGTPEDASPEYRWETDYWELDGHSHSYLTVREILEYNWDQTTTHAGYVGPLNYLLYKREGQPEEWCGFVSGARIKRVSHEEMDQFIELNNISLGDSYKEWDATTYTHIQWGVAYRACVESFLTKTLPALQQLGDPDEVRICFFFDN